MAPLPEAPVSITLKATLHGQEVLVTLRGVDFASVKAQVEDASQWLQAQRGQAADDTPGYCWSSSRIVLDGLKRGKLPFGLL
jgi:hypothetical protein